MTYNLLVIDEQQSEIEQIENFFELADDFEIFGLIEVQNLDGLYDYIFEKKIDVVVFDYKLMEHNSNFQMNGDKYLKNLLEKYQNFPTIILTNKAADAKLHHIDPFKVIDKELVNVNPEIEEEKKSGLELIKNIRILIDNYRKEIADAKNELETLLEKADSSKTITALEEERIIELDSFLEKSFSKTNRIPNSLKTTHSLDVLSKLIEDTDELIRNLKENE
jgi:DNA-binding NarL/FixJ family response regulator